MSGPQKFRKKPVEIEAMQWAGDNQSEIAAWVGAAPNDPYPAFHVFWERGAMLYVKANRTWLPVEVGEWVAGDSQGFYPIKNFVFQRSYEAVA